MPTFTTIALETLLEPRLRDSYKNSVNSKQVTSKPVRDDDEREEEKKKKPPAPNHIYISPALYTTPEPTPIPVSSSDSLSPSPYVVNHKRRGGEAINRRIDGFQVRHQRKQDGESNSNGVNDDDDNIWMNQTGDMSSSNVDSALQLQEEATDDNFLGVELNGKRNESSVMEDDDFFDPRCDSLSVTSSNELNDLGKQTENRGTVSNQGEFFDADEDFSSDGSISNVPSCGPSLESDLRDTRLILLEEIERRKFAEDALNVMYSQWQRFSNLLSQAGLAFPTPSNAGSMQLEINSIEQFSQELVVTRFVAEAIGKGQARAEAQIAAEAIIESKDQEVSRLRDRLQYYEAVNHEMSQRNQEVMEVARRQRQRKKSQRRWLWGCIGMSVAVGASVIAYSYSPGTSKHHPLLTSSDSCDASCISSLESARQ